MGYGRGNPTAENVDRLFSPEGTNVAAKWLKVPLSGGVVDSFTVAVQNPEAVDVLIVRAVLDITTAGGTATAVLNVDVVGTATETGDDIFDGVDANATAVLDSLNGTDNGSNGEGKTGGAERTTTSPPRSSPKPPPTSPATCICNT